MNKKPGDTIKFIRNKEYTFLKEIGQGGTGKTILVRDELTGIDFICKKYSPYNISKKNEYFTRFIDEIKLMYLLSHKNIVRIYNYFLYPELTTGYILMEYIDGESIDTYLMWQDKSVFENIFMQLIEGFDYLERHNILHRDIRSGNILVTNDGIVKIIDFGFGKKIEGETEVNASILLNWPVSDFPEEINNYIYNHQTEIYFVGKLFNKILEINEITDFKYQYIIDNMIIANPQKRIRSFTEIIESMSNDIFAEICFTDIEKSIYINFADSLISHIINIKKELNLITEPKEIISSLENVIGSSLVEDTLQDNSLLISCFVNSSYTYNKRTDIDMKMIKDFYKFFKSSRTNMQKIILNTINTRLRTVPIRITDEDIPF